VHEGDATAHFDPHKQYVAQYACEQAIFGQDTQFYGWHYRRSFWG
jgi:hypothetical protein